MTLTLRFVLLAASISNCAWILFRIRKEQVKIEDSVFWILWSFLLILMCLFPQVVELGARITGVQAPVNFVFLAIIFVLFLKLFRSSIRISQLEGRLQRFVQEYALDRSTDQSAEKEKGKSIH